MIFNEDGIKYKKTMKLFIIIKKLVKNQQNYHKYLNNLFVCE